MSGFEFSLCMAGLGALAFLGIGCMVVLVAGLVQEFREWSADRDQESEAQIEAELDRKQAALRQTVLLLADALAEESIAGRRASEEMIRAAYRARGVLPKR